MFSCTVGLCLANYPSAEIMVHRYFNDSPLFVLCTVLYDCDFTAQRTSSCSGFILAVLYFKICIKIRWLPHFFTLSSFPPTIVPCLSSLIIILPPPIPKASNINCQFSGLSNPNLIRGTNPPPQRWRDEEWRGDGRVKEEWIAERKSMIERETGQAKNKGGN